MTRAPVFAIDGIDKGERVKRWLVEHEIRVKKVAEATSKHLTLMAIEPTLVGRNLWVRLRFLTGEAMGMNMVTIATQAVVELMEKELTIRGVALSGNACVDKKPAWSNVLLGRGLRVNAEVVVPREVVEATLKTTPEAVVEVVTRKSHLGSIVSGAMGFNGHFANIVAAIYLATGQDVAHVVEGSAGVTTAELDGRDLYFNVTMPNVLVGTVGGGTRLPVQKAALSIMGLGMGKLGEKLTLGRVLGATVLAGELSLTAALAAGHLASAHARLGRSRI
jgi:hydroxymethylglutaryl-CoA reductase (NADPH)